MNMKRMAAAVAGVLTLGGLGSGVALAGSSGTVTPATEKVQPVTSAQAPDDPNEPAEKEGTEQKGAEEPGDENLPGGGHADPEGQNVDHQFEGVE